MERNNRKERLEVCPNAPQRTTKRRYVLWNQAHVHPLWSRRVYRVMAKVSLCSKVVIPDYYPCCKGYRLER